MQDTENPLRFHFCMVIAILAIDLIKLFLKLTILNDFPAIEILPLNLSVILHIVIFAGFFVFLYFYIRNSMMAWYSLFITFCLIVPFFLKSNSFYKHSSIALLILWVIFCSELLIKYKFYKKYVNDETK